jgi:hypothetical protein
VRVRRRPYRVGRPPRSRALTAHWVERATPNAARVPAAAAATWRQ